MMPDHTDVPRAICRECAQHELGDADAHKAAILPTVDTLVDQLMAACVLCRHGLMVTFPGERVVVRLDKEGCTQVVELADRMEHEQSCAKAFVRCGLPHSLNDSENCTMEVRQEELEAHREHCKHRVITCPHEACGMRVQVHRLNAHVKICGFKHIVCPNRGVGCWQGPRKELGKHLAVCQGAKIACGHDDSAWRGNPCPAVLPRR